MDVLPIQPSPVASEVRSLPFVPLGRPAPEITWVNQSENAGGWTTAIGRAWPKGATSCGLCPVDLCNLEGGFCLVTVRTHVSDEAAPAFSLADHLGVAAADDLGSGRYFG
jgi:hypothetical protein